MTNQRPGHLVVTLVPGAALAHLPCHLDCLIGANRPVSRIDDGPIDRLLRRWAGGFRVALAFHARRSLGRVGRQHESFGALEEELGLSRVLAVRLGEEHGSADAAAALSDLAGVESASVQTLTTVSAEAPFVTAAPTWEAAWRPRDRVRLREALEIEPGDERIRVAVLDTGVSLGHPEFRGRLLAGYDSVDLGLGRVGARLRLIGDSFGADFTPRDDVGHGSHVAGIISAHGWSMPPGGAGRCLLLPIRVLAAAASQARPGRRVGVGALEQIDAGLKVAVDLGAHVCNLSLGTPKASLPSDLPRPHERMVRYADRYGCVLVAAAGNSGRREEVFPAALPGVIAVGSASEDGRRSPFSTWGEQVALCAPGERIVSAGRRGYKESSGTSHAAPFVTSAVALLLSRARRRGRSLTTAQVRDLLCASAVPLGGGINPETGHGLLDMAAALRQLDHVLDERPLNHPRPTTQGDAHAQS